MSEKKGLIKTKKQMFIVVGAFVLVLLLGTASYAFFNYTRTGGTNTARTGTISFNTDQNNDTLTLTNVFPSSSVPVGADSVAVHITGDTSYSGGVEFQVTLVNVVNTVNNKTVPINYVATYTATPTTGNIGTSKSSDDAYFSDRGSTTTVYKLTGSGEVSEGKEVLKGYIASGAANGIDGVLTIQAYLDSSKVLISDTIQDGEIEASGYVNGTPGAEVVLTTAEWNSLTGNNTLSFKIRAVANEGTWILNPNGYAANIKCQRVTDATKLHTETCAQTSDYCAADGYTGDNTLITYGNAKQLNTQLATGDAFDCDVNGNGIIDKDGNGNSTERFYYVSEYYNTDTKAFDTSAGYATLIYYSNTYNNGTSVVVSDSAAAYATQADIQAIDSNVTSADNWHGPVTAVGHLPTTSTWSNMTLKTTSRTILACDNGDCSNTPVLTTNNGSKTITNPFSYEGKAARLLTVQELKQSGCDTLSSQTSLTNTGGLTACNFLFEGTSYADSSKVIYGPWLETPRASNSFYVWYPRARERYVYNASAFSINNCGVRPTIDVPYSLIAY